MEIDFLGSGSAFVLAEENYQSNILFTQTKDSEQKRMLFDAGSTIAESLHSQGLEPTDLDAIVISHLHGDHCGGLEYIGFKTYFIPEFGTRRPTLIANNQVMEKLWNNVLSGTMESTNGKTVNLSTYFKVHPLKPKEIFQFADISFALVQVPHIISDKIEVPSFGMRFEVDGLKIFLTGDSQFDYWRFIGFYETYDVIFQECEFANYQNSVHTQFHELCKLPETFRKKMWLYHYSLGEKTFEELEKEVLDNGFAGLIKRGQIFDTEKRETFGKALQ